MQAKNPGKMVVQAYRCFVAESYLSAAVNMTLHFENHVKFVEVGGGWAAAVL